MPAYPLPRPPEYGSPAWQALPDTDPAKTLAVLFAAECWRRWWQPDAHAWRLAAAERHTAARFKAVACDLSAALDWATQANQPSFAELQRRRGLA